MGGCDQAPGPGPASAAAAGSRCIAVTGAAGFVGRHLVAALRHQGDRVRVLRHRAAMADPAGLNVVQGGLGDADALARLTDGADAVVHLAGLVAARRPSDFHAVNADGTERLARAARDAGVGRLLYVSTLAAREPHLSAYAASKRAGEQRLAAVDGLAWDVLRPPAVYGPGDVGLLTLFRLLRRRIALLPNGGAGRLALIHVDDLVAAVLAWLAAPAAGGGCYEVADPGAPGYTWRRVMAAAAAELGVEPIYVRPPAGLLRLAAGGTQAAARALGRAPFLTPDKIREMHHLDWSADPSAFARATGWRANVDLETGLRGTLRWYRERGWL